VIPDAGFGTIEEIIQLKFGGPSASSQEADGRRRGPRTRRGSRRGASRVLVKRRGAKIKIGDGAPFTTIDSQLPFLALAGSPGQKGEIGYLEGRSIESVIKRILVHLPFETLPAWAARSLDRKSALRSTALLTPAPHLEKLGINLASAYHALKNNFGRDHWDATIDYVRLGLGQHIEDVGTWVDPGGGNIGLSLKLVGLDLPIPSAQLSDGMLSYLAFVAMFRLHARPPTLLCFDEPDLHLHPHLLMRVLDFFESMARDTPVLLATHSDRLLDGLTDPARSVVLCALDERGATRLARPDPQALAKWLERYRGLGDLRGAGHAASVLTKTEPG
jgi:predicted ATPase